MERALLFRIMNLNKNLILIITKGRKMLNKRGLKHLAILIALSTMAVSCTGRMKARKDKTPGDVMPELVLKGLNVGDKVVIDMGNMQLESIAVEKCAEGTDKVLCVNPSKQTLISKGTKKDSMLATISILDKTVEHLAPTPDIATVSPKTLRVFLKDAKLNGGEGEEWAVLEKVTMIDVTKTIVAFKKCKDLNAPITKVDDLVINLDNKKVFLLIAQGQANENNVCNVLDFSKRKEMIAQIRYDLLDKQEIDKIRAEYNLALEEAAIADSQASDNETGIISDTTPDESPDGEVEDTGSSNIIVDSLGNNGEELVEGTVIDVEIQSVPQMTEDQKRIEKERRNY